MVRRRTAVVLVAAAAVVATIASLGNGFAYDDVPIVAENPALRGAASPLSWFGQGYWPREEGAANYRPWTMWMFNLQWIAGGGSPAVFHAANLVLAAANACLVVVLAWRILSPAGALAAGLLFAVHPVHVEATGNVVGQAELWMALFVLGGCVLALAATRPLDARHRGILVVALVAAATAKEQGFLLPGFLLLAAAASGERLGPLLARERRLVILFVLVGGMLAVARTAVVGGAGVGVVAPGLRGLDPLPQVQVALSVVPEALRLLLWPAALSADYSPPMVGARPGWSAQAVGGAMILLAAAGIALLARRRAPVVAAAIAWTALAWFPVSNLVAPTGILLAERTLYLPSVGVALLAGWLVEVVTARGHTRPAMAVVVLITVLGAARSHARQPVWRDNRSLFSQMVVDAPRSYRTHALLATIAIEDGDLARAAALYARGDSLWPHDPRLLEDWAHLERRRIGCDAAIPLLERSLALDPGRPVATVKLAECRRVGGGK